MKSIQHDMCHLLFLQQRERLYKMSMAFNLDGLIEREMPVMVALSPVTRALHNLVSLQSCLESGLGSGPIRLSSIPSSPPSACSPGKFQIDESVTQTSSWPSSTTLAFNILT